MARRLFAFFFVFLFSVTVFAEDPIRKYCGAAPATDPTANAPLQVAERLLSRVLSTREKVFNAYRSQYNKNRKRIIKRNSRLPKSQHLPVPNQLTDTQLRATKEYRGKEEAAHAAPADEEAARDKIVAAKAKLAETKGIHDGCKAEILDRLRTASTKSAQDILKLPAAQRLREEDDRLRVLRQQFLAMLETRRTDKETMVPILSSAICARRNIIQRLDADKRSVARQARLTGSDATLDLAAIDDQREEHRLEITELNRDFKIFRSRKMRCRKASLMPLIRCIEAKLMARDQMPSQCSTYTVELELLGYAKRKWQ